MNQHLLQDQIYISHTTYLYMIYIYVYTYTVHMYQCVLLLNRAHTNQMYEWNHHWAISGCFAFNRRFPHVWEWLFVFGFVWTYGKPKKAIFMEKPDYILSGTLFSGSVKFLLIITPKVINPHSPMGCSPLLIKMGGHPQIKENILKKNIFISEWLEMRATQFSVFLLNDLCCLYE